MSGTLTLPTISPLSGTTLVGDTNAALASLGTLQAGSSAPTTGSTGLSGLAGLVWHDTSTNTLKVRDQADGAWITAGYFDETNKTFTPAITPATFYAADTGSANAYAAAPVPAWGAYAVGKFLMFKATNANTTASTLNVSTLGAKSIKRMDGSALQANDILAGAFYLVQYDGTNFILLTITTASTSVAGVVKLASGSDVSTGTDANKAVTAAALVAAGQSLGTNGYVTLPGGMILQWGTSGSVAVNSSVAVSFPLTFPNHVWNVQATPNGTTYPNGSPAIASLSTSGFTLWNGDNRNAPETYSWTAIGN